MIIILNRLYNSLNKYLNYNSDYFDYILFLKILFQGTY